MANLSIAPPSQPAGAVPRSEKPPRRERAIHQLLAPLASLRLTVVLFVLAIFIVLAGTLAQIDAGIWSVVKQYFRSALVWIPLQIFFPRTMSVPGSFPFPGGWLIGGLLLINLLAAHVLRFKLSWRRSGILLIHAGLIVMMVSELVTGLFAVEAKMSIAQGETVNFTDESQHIELALTHPVDSQTDDEVVIPGALLRKPGLIQNEQLPVDVEVLEFMKNSSLARVPEGETGADIYTTKDGSRYRIVDRSEEKGVDPDQREDAAAVRIRIRKKGTDQVLGTFLVSLWMYPNFTFRQIQFPPQHFQLDGQEYAVELRFRREYKPYRLHLIKFDHSNYIGTDKPRNFSSRVRLQDDERHEDREVLIYMNEPLRYAGHTFYQSGYFPDDSGTVLQVVRNPGWLMPYVSCVMVALGMIVHFGMHLVKFLRRRMA